MNIRVLFSIRDSPGWRGGSPGPGSDSGRGRDSASLRCNDHTHIYFDNGSGDGLSAQP